MTHLEFLKEMEIIIDADSGSVAMENQLAFLAGWDSMAVISFIAMVDAHQNRSLDTTALASCKTVGDLAVLAGVSGVGEGK